MSEHSPDDLDVVQRWFQAVVTHPQGVGEGVASDEAQRLIRLKRSELEKIVRRSKNLSAEERLGIYANAYYARLIECLRESFPVLAKTLGVEVFDGFAFDYLQRYPSKSYTLNRLGDHFAQYLDQTRPAEESATIGWPDFLIDLARLEWSIEQVFDGPGTERDRVLSPADLAGVDPATFGSTRIVCAPCLRLLAFRYPVNEYYAAARRLAPDAEPQTMPADPREQFLALTRRDYVVRRIEISRPQYTLLKALLAGSTVDQAIVAAGECWDGDEARFAAAIRDWFAQWSAAGLIWRIEP